MNLGFEKTSEAAGLSTFFLNRRFLFLAVSLCHFSSLSGSWMLSTGLITVTMRNSRTRHFLRREPKAA